ncbi:MAG: selenocysteine-specific translation elongation factor [Bryobacteraceae bacterium]|nr:selenocysteine-specific translation elongation factor [Bryobacteraceae bacterium]
MKSDRMTFIVAGTAGHIDHGKTALVRALTGIDTDRLEEEKRRGISIDLGFAHLELPSGARVSFIDVPGHERFVKNMLAGVGGIDLVLLVVAADEGIKPQTLEHFDICRLLGIQKGIIALTKVDAVEPELVELVRLEVEEFVAGSFLEGAPAVPVSAVTGVGLAELKGEIERLGRAVRARDASRPFRLPVDRSFSMRGFGTIVTGTLVAGALAAEQEVEVYPVGRVFRVRGLQVHGVGAGQALAGQRTAVNLAGVEATELGRGMTLGPPGVFRATTRVEAELDLLPGAKPLKQRAPVHFHAGTAELEAEVRLLSGAAEMLPGERALVRLVLREPALLLPGDRFIIRMFSPVVTIGGGRVLDVDPPRRALLARAEAVARAESLGEMLLAESRTGMSVRELTARTGVWEPAGGWGVALGEWRMARAAVEGLLSELQERVREFHKKTPLSPGMASEELRQRVLGNDAPAFLLDGLLGQSKTLVREGDVVRLASHRVAFQEDESEALAKMEQAFRAAGLAAPATAQVLAASGVEPARARPLLQILLRQRRLVKVSEELVFHVEAIESLRAMLAGRKGTRFGVAEFKEWTGVSRKYAIPLLEYLDRERVTRREGDQRVVVG